MGIKFGKWSKSAIDKNEFGDLVRDPHVYIMCKLEKEFLINSPSAIFIPDCSQCPGILSYHIAAETWKRLSAQSLDGFTAAPVETNSAHSSGGDEGEAPANNGDDAVNGVEDKAQPTGLGM